MIKTTFFAVRFLARPIGNFTAPQLTHCNSTLRTNWYHGSRSQTNQKYLTASGRLMSRLHNIHELSDFSCLCSIFSHNNVTFVIVIKVRHHC